MKNRAHLSEPAVRTKLLDDLFGHRCVLCGKRSKDVRIISWSKNGDPFLRVESSVDCHKYHMICVRNILNDPGRYTEPRIDIAVDIVKRLSVRTSRQRAYDLSLLKSQVNGLRQKDHLNKEANRARHLLREL